MKKIMLLTIVSFCTSNVHAQLLKKLKDKVNKAVENTTGTGNKSSNEGATANTDPKEAKTNINWCDTLNHTASYYSMAYTSPVNFRIMYDESRLGIRRKKSDYRLILQQSAGNKTQFVIIDNGQVTATVSSLTDDQIIGGLHGALDGINGGPGINIEKFLVADSTSVTVQGQDSKTLTVPKIDEDQVSRGFEMMKKTEEYKKMSPEEKKEIEDAMNQKSEIVKVLNSNRSDNDKVTIQGIKGGTYTSANGSYGLIIKGKNYGKFAGKPILNISEDEENVYIVGSEGNGKTVFISNDKRITLTSKAQSYMGHSGNIIISPDGQKAVFIEMKTLTDKEFEERNKSVESGGKFTVTYLVTKSDGTSFPILRKDGGDRYRLTNSGALVYVDKDTREVYSDGKPIAKFTGEADGGTISEGLIVGNDPSKICYYMDDGSLTFLDGSQKKMGIVFPQVISDNGKTYLTWFRKCKNDIYIGKFEF